MPPCVLTARQVRLLEWAANGQTYRQTAATLCTSEQAIKNQMQTISEMLGADNCRQACVMAIRRGLIE